MLTVGDQIPSFSVVGVKPKFNQHTEDNKSAFEEITEDSFAGQWKVIYFYPKDFTFVCPTEIINFSKLADEFKERNFVNVITKKEEYKTNEGDQGIKIFGSFDDNNLNKKRDYETILFVVNKLSIKLEVIFERKNEDLKTVSNRVISSLKFIK